MILNKMETNIIVLEKGFVQNSGYGLYFLIILFINFKSLSLNEIKQNKHNTLIVRKYDGFISFSS